MRKLLLIALMCSPIFLLAQTPRMVLIEEATQASCPPCAGLNPQVQALVNANSDNTIFLGYQVWWPGYDPMFLDNPDEVVDRVGYYGINAAPTLVYQGTPSAQTVSQSLIDQNTATDSEFAITLEAEVRNGVLQVSGNVEATMAASGDFKLRIALSEDLITIEDAPGGTNGETEYHHVFKKFIGGSAGYDLEDTWAVGDTYEINGSLALGDVNIYHYDGLEVIAWIQNDADQYVHQAAKTTEISITSDYANNGITLAASNLPVTVCGGMQVIEPVFKLQNGGGENLTSATITYSVNGGDPQTYNWTGDIAPPAAEEIALPAIAFDAVSGEVSTLNIMVTEPNGMTDEDTSNDATSATIDPAPNTMGTATLTLVTDNYGNETYWQVSNSAGDVVASGGNAGVGLNNIGVGAGSPPADAGSYGNNQTITVEIPIDVTDCYTFTITDYWGDGICCAYGNGSYEMVDHEGNVMFSGGSFAALNSDDMEGEMVVGTEELTEVSDIRMFPNPVQDQLTVDFNLEESSRLQMEVFNATGQRVQQLPATNFVAGNNRVQINTAAIANGIYFLRIYNADRELSRRFVVQH